MLRVYALLEPDIPKSINDHGKYGRADPSGGFLRRLGMTASNPTAVRRAP